MVGFFFVIAASDSTNLQPIYVVSMYLSPVANYHILFQDGDDAECCGQSVVKTNRSNSCCFSYKILLFTHLLLLPLCSCSSTQPQVGAELKSSLENSYLLRSLCFFARVCPSLFTTLCVSVCFYRRLQCYTHTHTHTSM